MKKDATILLVEDNRADIKLTLAALRAENLCNDIDVVRDGEEALDYMFCRGTYAKREGKRPPCMVLLDLKLPKLDGIEVLRRLKTDERTRMIPVVILTSSSEERDLFEGYRLGVNSYIQKPVDFESFRQTVKQLGFYWLVVNHEAPIPAAEPAKA